MYMQEYTALYTSPSNNNSTGKPELTPMEEGTSPVPGSIWIWRHF